jgi:hypothetical protein
VFQPKLQNSFGNASTKPIRLLQQTQISEALIC